TILPNSFVVALTPQITRIHVQRGFVIPQVPSDVRAVKHLLNELTRVNKRILEIQNESMRLANTRGQIIHRIEAIMQEFNWDEESCTAVRSRLNPVRIEGNIEKQIPSQDLLAEVLGIFEKLLDTQPKKKNENDESQEVRIDIE
ncbi:MAG: hypothetical protein P1Q69_20230, partial [Candidatus Thorarchaeota archaeon]|nr:hypothetical protein [Candidatus Thorarchaeota archaeon]